ncbi:unnamed protein product [Lepidochelys kempii]
MKNWKREAPSTHPPAECFPVVQHGGEWTEVSSGGDIANLILNAQIPRDINRSRGSWGTALGTSQDWAFYQDMNQLSPLFTALLSELSSVPRLQKETSSYLVVKLSTNVSSMAVQDFCYNEQFLSLGMIVERGRENPDEL